MNTQTEAATTKKARLAVTKAYNAVNPAGDKVETKSLKNGVTYSSVTISAIGEDDITASLSDVNLNHLAAYGLRALLLQGTSEATTIPAFFRIARENLDSLIKGEYSSRGGERGVNFDRFAKICANAKEIVNMLGTDDEAEIATRCAAKVAALDEKTPATKDKPSGGQAWIALVRSHPAYQASSNQLFPRKPREVKAKDLTSLFDI